MKRIAFVSVISLIVAFVCGAAPASVDTPEGVDLAQLDGWDIVIADDAIPSEKYAAQEFQELFRQASRVKLPIIQKTDRPDRHIFIGPSKMLRASSVGFAVDDFGDEDLRIVIRDGNIAIAGGRPRGTLYGVYTFMEDYLGVRFLTADHTHVPPVPDGHMLGPVDHFYHPPLSFRSTYYGEFKDQPDFSARLRNNFILYESKLGTKHGGSSSWRLINHSFFEQLPVEKYREEHPEYYALIDGKRLVEWQSQPCLTNPEVLRIVIESVKETLKSTPEVKNVSVSMNDNYNYCRCPRCAAIDEREGTPMGSLLTFVNAVADDIANIHPDIYVGTLAYLYARKPPKTIKARPNVQIMLCSIECSILQPINDPNSKMNRSFCEDLVAWGKICKNIMIWNYNVNYHCYLWPVPNLRVLEPNVRLFVNSGAKGVFMQAAGDSVAGDFSELRTYIICRLLWNPNLSGQKLMNEFLDLHYGKAAPPVRRFINFMHDRVAAKGIERNCFGSARRDFGIDDEIISAGLKAFQEASRLADNDQIRRRVEQASISVYGAAIEEAYRWAWLNVGGVLGRPTQPGERTMDPAFARQYRHHLKRFFDLCETYGVTRWTEVYPIENTRNMMRRAYGLKEDESF